MASQFSTQAHGAHGVPILKGKSNFASWKFVIQLLEKKKRAESSNKKKKDEHKELDLDMQTVIATTISEEILPVIAECESAKEMILKIENLYGLNQNDLAALHSEFQNFAYDNHKSLQENVCRLESIRTKIEGLNDVVSEFAFRTRLLSSLPKRFNSIKAACNLNRGMKLDELIALLAAEDYRLSEDREHRSSGISDSGTRMSSTCFICKKIGHIAKDCHSKIPSIRESNVQQRPTKAQTTSIDDRKCNYCKTPGHVIASCEKLKAKRAAECRKCGVKGHYEKNCTSELRPEDSERNSNFMACMGLTSLVAASKKPKILKESWILDCACTAHVSNDRRNFSMLNPKEGRILIGNSKTEVVNEVGEIKARCLESNLLFQNVMLNERSPANLVSLIRLLRNGWIITEFTVSRIELARNKFKIVAELDDNELWVIPLSVIKTEKSNVVNEPNVQSTLEVSCLSLARWHRNFAHQNIQYTRDLLRRAGIKFENVSKNFKCTHCIKGKITRLPFQNSSRVAEEVGELTHADMLISPTLSLGGSKYALVLKDDLSRYHTVYFTSTKSETVELFTDYFNRVETQTGNKPKRIRSDNGTEEVNKDIDKLSSDRGIIHELSCPFTPEQNGRVEREMRVLSEAATTLLTENGLSKKFWAEAMAYTVYTLNRVGKSTVDDKTPYELFNKRGLFDLKMLKPFGSKCILQIPQEKRKKFDPKGREGIFIGYPPDSKGYKVWIESQKKIMISRNVVFLNEESNEKSEVIPEESEEVEVIEMEYDWDEPDVEIRIEMTLINVHTPESYQDLDSMNDEERRFWNTAIRRELDSMEKNEVWTPVPSNNQRLVDTKWIFRIKDTEEGKIGKARLVAKGFMSNEFKETYAPVANITSIRTFLSIAVHRRMVIKQIDVETAFLNGSLEEEIHIKAPQGYRRSGAVLRLKKALYGLKQAPRCWYSLLDSVLEAEGFKKSKSEYCLYVKSNDLYLITYVDDFLIAGSSVELVESVIIVLKNHFAVKVMHRIERFIGLHLEVGESGQLKIDQRKYIEQCIEKFRVEDGKKVKSPEMKLDLNIKNSSKPKNDDCILKFQKLLGALNYVMERSRPDINFSVNMLSRHALSADEEKYRYLVRVLKYLNSTKNLTLVYRTIQSAAPLEAYSDASWAPEKDRKSTSGYVIFVYGNLVHYKSRKQTLVALSTTESEYVALTECAREVMWIKNIMEDMGLDVGSSIVHGDNQASIKIAESNGNYNRTKHIDLKYHYIKDLVNKNLVKLSYVNTNSNVADMFTKIVPSNKINETMLSLGFQ